MENNQKNFGLARGKKLLIFLVLSLFITAGFIFIENPVYSSIYGFINKETKIDIKSDAELVSELQAHREEFNRLIQQIRQIEMERQMLASQLDTNNKIIEQQLKQNAEINKNNEQLKKDEMLRLEKEKNKNIEFFHNTIEAKRKEVDQPLQKLGYVKHSHYVSQGQIVIPQKNFYYEEGHFFSNLKNSYSITKGFILFDENMQPDKRYVVDNLDNFHSSGNIILSTQKFIAKFGQKGTIYHHIEGNLYLFLAVSYSPNHYPNSFDYEY